MKLGCLTLFVVLLSLAGPGHAETLTLIDKQGRSIKADVIGLESEIVKIKREDGRSFDLSLDTLSDESRKELDAWAKREADKPPAAGTIEVSAARGKFNSTKTQQTETFVTRYTDGSSKTDTRIRYTVQEDWGFSLTVSNKSLKRIEGLRVEYKLFGENAVSSGRIGLSGPFGPGSRVGPAGRARSDISTVPIERLKARDQVVFKTNTLTFTKSYLQGETIPSVGSQLQGVWVRIYRGDVLVHEASSPETLRLSKEW